MSSWFYPYGTLKQGPWVTAVTNQIPGWLHTGLLIGEAAGGPHELAARSTEYMIIPLHGTTEVVWSGSHLDTSTGTESLTRTEFF